MKENVKIFHLLRHVDGTGISGTGVVAIGCQLSSGTCVLEWTSFHSSLGIFKHIDEILLIHGHNGNSEIVWGLPEDAIVKPSSPKKRSKPKPPPCKAFPIK